MICDGPSVRWSGFSMYKKTEALGAARIDERIVGLFKDGWHG